MAPKKKHVPTSALLVDRRLVGVEDMVLLKDVTNEAISANLAKRFQADEIYT